MSGIGVAVVGAGGWGKNHVRNFAGLPGARLLHVCDLDPDVRERVTSEYSSLRVTGDLSEVLDDSAVKAVVVATDAPSHFEIAKAALEADKDLLVEKPLALSTKHGQALCDLAETRGRILMVGHLLLFHPAVQQLKARITSGELGTMLYLVAQRTNLGIVRQDENAWWSLAPHDLSVASYLFDEAPTSVSANGGVFLQKERQIEDVVFATVRYGQERLAHIHVSWLDPFKQRRMTAVGSKKMAVFDDALADQKLKVFDKGVEPTPKALSYSEGVRLRTGDILIPAVRMNEPLRRECEAFLSAVQTREPPLSDGRSGLQVVQALEAGAKSLEQGGVEVPVEELS